MLSAALSAAVGRDGVRQVKNCFAQTDKAWIDSRIRAFGRGIF